MVDTLKFYNNQPIPASDPTLSLSPDKRVFLKIKKSRNIPSPSASGDYGIGVYKFTARNADGTLPSNYNAAYACTDFPVFRLADAYLMRAEALYRMGGEANIAAAVADINKIRERAYGNTSGNITASDLDLDFKLTSADANSTMRLRDALTLRFGKFTVAKSVAVEGWCIHRGRHFGAPQSFPIPGDELSSNPNYNGVNNPGY